ncbi:MAG: hypothetical protein KDJ52_36455, partial [Anaerolineae bacterium]|nr:hypothetical protein [Anaerolineae bacterium]
KDRVLAKSRPLSELFTKRPDQRDVLDSALADSGLSPERLVWLPVTSFHSTGWVALLDASSADLKAFAPVDGF